MIGDDCCGSGGCGFDAEDVWCELPWFEVSVNCLFEFLVGEAAFGAYDDGDVVWCGDVCGNVEGLWVVGVCDEFGL